MPQSDIAETRLADPPESFQADSLAIGMAVMLVMTVIQRGIGFFRGIWFCRLMDDSVIGQFSMAMTFLILITPIMLFGLPGSLPRFVEHFRLRGHLSAFVRRIAIGTALCGVLFVTLMTLFPGVFGWAIFLDPGSSSLVWSLAAAVAVTIAFNFISDLNSSLRQIRVVSVMHFTQSLAFTTLGVAWLLGGGGLVGLVMTHFAATCVAILPGVVTLVRGWKGLPVNAEPFCGNRMWRRLLPYAFALWMMNVIGNIFELSDRYMILHWLPGTEVEGQSAVGQYHSARIIPVLLLSLATMLSGILLPYLAADWEQGRVNLVRDRMRKFLFGFAACITLVGAAAISLAPWIFTHLLQGRYDDGLAVLPMAFLFCGWTALSTLAQDYLWVIEKGKYVTIALLVGLVANVGLNAWLIPDYGLLGAVWATTAANALVLVGIWVAMVAHDFGIDSTALYVLLLPASLLAGPAVALGMLFVILVASPDARGGLSEVAGLFARKIAGKRTGSTTV